MLCTKDTATFIACVFIHTYIHGYKTTFFSVWAWGRMAEWRMSCAHSKPLDPTMHQHKTPGHNFKNQFSHGKQDSFCPFPPSTHSHTLSPSLNFLQHWRQDSGYIKSTGIDFGVRLHWLTNIRSFCRHSRAQSYTAWEQSEEQKKTIYICVVMCYSRLSMRQMYCRPTCAMLLGDGARLHHLVYYTAVIYIRKCPLTHWLGPLTFNSQYMWRNRAAMQKSFKIFSRRYRYIYLSCGYTK